MLKGLISLSFVTTINLYILYKFALNFKCAFPFRLQTATFNKIIKYRKHLSFARCNKGLSTMVKGKKKTIDFPINFKI